MRTSGPRRPQKKPLPRAISLIAGTLVLSVLCAALFVAYFVMQRSSLAQQQLRHDIVLRGADAIGLSFNTALKREWDSLNAVARSISGADKSEIDDFVDAVAQTGGQVAWSGVAGLDGRIISGSNRLREGEDVSARRWFREGLRRPNVGNVYASDTLGRDQPDRRQSLLNLSTPVLDPETDEVTGVLVYSLRMTWVESFLRRARQQLNIDVLVQNREGDTLLDTRTQPSSLPPAILARAELGNGSPGTFRLLGSDQGLYAYSPNFISDELPDFGWRVFAVLDSSTLIDVMPQLLRSSVIAVSIAAAFVLALTLLVARIVLQPLEVLVATATGMAEGRLEYPRESRSSREASDLSQALTRMQATLALHERLKAARGPLLRMPESDETLTTRGDGEATEVDPEEAPRQTPTRRRS